MANREQQRVRYWPVRDEQLEWILRFLNEAAKRVQDKSKEGK